MSKGHGARAITRAGVAVAVATVAVGCRGNPAGSVIAGLGPPAWDDQLYDSLEQRYRDLPGYIAAHYDGKEPAERRRARNRICTDLMWMIDYTYARDVHNLRLGDDGLNFAGDLATLGLTTAATIAGEAGAKTILAGLATFIVGGRTALDADLLHRQAVTSLVAEMNAVRKSRATELLEGLTVSDEQYSLHMALRDVYAYKLGGSPLGAIAELETMTSRAEHEADVRLAGATQKYRDAGGDDAPDVRTASERIPPGASKP